jgi:DNA helicase HerA-like ATPase
MLLDLAERGRYLGLVLFSAQQFRSQVHRRVVGNSGTALYGRMDADELATPGYSVLSAAVKTKLASLEKGQLMVRHPHFTQPIFVRFPRPAIMRGRDGAERFPQAVDIDLDAAVLRSLRALDPSLTLGWVQEAIGIRDDDEIIRARNATLRERPADVRKFFLSQLRPVIAAHAVARPGTAPVRSAPIDDPYGF